jgi:hypothetical protein
MTFPELKETVGTALEQRLVALEIEGVGLYYDALPSSRERLVVRFFFPTSGAVTGTYGALGTVERPLLQIDVIHFPKSGSVVVPDPASAEAIWEALKLTALPGVAGVKRDAAGRPPSKDPSDYSLWGFHRFHLTVT